MSVDPAGRASLSAGVSRRPIVLKLEGGDLCGYIELALRGGFPDAALRLTGRARDVAGELHRGSAQS